MNYYELHVTVNIEGKELIQQFIKDCNSINVKPIVIETEKDGEYHNQVMTSFKVKADEYKTSLNKLVIQLIDFGYHVVREKVEMEPGDEKHPDHIYYESHLRLRLPNGFDLTNHKVFFNSCNFHLSKNVFKRTDTHFYQMLTYRTNVLNLSSFKIIVEAMKQSLASIDIECDKTEIEECIYDTNETIDASWLNGNM